MDEARRVLALADDVESPEADARRIVEAASGCQLAEFDRVLGEPAAALSAARFGSMLERRAAGEPLQYVVGSWGFRSLDLMIDRRVLIPRPETEVVAGWAVAEVERLAARRSAFSGGDLDAHGMAGALAWRGPADMTDAADVIPGLANMIDAVDVIPGPADMTDAVDVIPGLADMTDAADVTDGAQADGASGALVSGASDALVSGALVADAADVVVADLGTGSGAIALSVAVECPRARVFATDVSSEALAVARANLAGIGRPAARVSLHRGDWYGALPAALQGSLDVVVSNPPYIGTGEELPPVVARWEPPVALWSGPSGDEAVGRVIAGAVRWLRSGGAVVVEVASHRARQSAAFAVDAGFIDVRVELDLAGLERVVIGRCP